VLAPPPTPQPAPPAAEPERRVEPLPEASAAARGADVEVVSASPEAHDGPDFVYGSRDGQLFLRTRGDDLVVLPAAWLQINGASLASPNPYTSYRSLDVGRARVDVAAWIYGQAYFSLSADFASSVSVRHTDNFVAMAPLGDLLILQLGQFDAPFTLENRTSDRYLDFADRGFSVRAFAIPENKDQGLMIHGLGAHAYYSAAVLNGQGPDFTGIDSHVDLMARGWVAPFSFGGPEVLRAITVGGSLWTGDRSGGGGLPFRAQLTQGGFNALDSSLWSMTGSMNALALREEQRLNAAALELDAPFAHRVGVRLEWIAKKQPLAAFDVEDPMQAKRLGGLTLSGWGGYAEVRGWVLGDDRILGRPATPGVELPLRYEELAETSPRGGLMLAARIDYVDQTLTPSPAARAAGLGFASQGTTKVTAVMLGATYWYTRRARLTLNYVFNHLDGATPILLGLDSRDDREILLRMALAL
jgi:hypothetical protein